MGQLSWATGDAEGIVPARVVAGTENRPAAQDLCGSGIRTVVQKYIVALERVFSKAEYRF